MVQGTDHRTFFSTLNSEQWGAYGDGLGETVSKMLPSELYAKTKARDTAKRENKQRDASTTINGGKEANFMNKDLKSRIDDRGHATDVVDATSTARTAHTPTIRKSALAKKYVRRMKQQYGDDYIKCGHCHYQPTFNVGNIFNAGNSIANITEYEALQTANCP